MLAKKKDNPLAAYFESPSLLESRFGSQDEVTLRTIATLKILPDSALGHHLKEIVSSKREQILGKFVRICFDRMTDEEAGLIGKDLLAMVCRPIKPPRKC